MQNQTNVCLFFNNHLCVFESCISGVFQVLQQESVELDSLDEVDSSGKTLLDRLTLPVIFPDGYKHSCCFRKISFWSKLYFYPFI